MTAKRFRHHRTRKFAYSHDHPPDHELEREIAEIWEDFLQVSPIGVRSDFFDLGGDSLALVSLFATIEARFGRRLTVDVLAGGLTIAGLAQLLGHEQPLQAELDPVVALQPLRRSSAILLCSRDWRRRAAPAPSRRAYGYEPVPFLGLRRTPEARPTETLNEMAARYVAAMLAHQPVGPFYLGGALLWCDGCLRDGASACGART